MKPKLLNMVVQQKGADTNSVTSLYCAPANRGLFYGNDEREMI